MGDTLGKLVVVLGAAVVAIAMVFATLAINMVLFAAILVFIDFLAGTTFFSWGVAAALSIIWMVIR